MGSKGGKKHIKALATPKSWNIERKRRVWTAKPRAGPHSIADALPIGTVLTVFLKKTGNVREVELLLNRGEVLIDGRIVKDAKFPVGFMDVLSMPTVKEHYLMVYDKYARLKLQALDKEQKFKLCRIVSKNVTAKNKKQIGLHDGRTMLVDKEYRVGDILTIAVPEQKVLDHFEFKKGNLAFITGGKHSGKIGKIKEEILGTISREALVVMEKDGESYNVPKRYVFIIGRDKPEIKIE